MVYASSTLPPGPAAPSRRLTLDQARAHSRLIATLRTVFVAAAVASLTAVFVSTVVHGFNGGFAARSTMDGSAPLTMVNPRFSGRSATGEAFQITAEVATREGAASPRVSLNRPVYRDSAGRIMVAPNGLYDESQRQILLQGQVTVIDGAGNRFNTADARIDVENNVVRGENGIVGEGQLGVLRAGAYEFDQQRRTTRFYNSVVGTIPDRSTAD
jgi:lipopolysaccharide export system protein LptC